MIKVFSIHKALRDRLDSQKGALVLAGEDYTPTGAAYMQCKTLPATSRALTVNKYDQGAGIFQIDLRTPKSQGTFYAKATADQVAAIFPRGERYSHAGQEVTTGAVSIAAPFDDGAYIWTPISVPYDVFG